MRCTQIDSISISINTAQRFYKHCLMEIYITDQVYNILLYYLYAFFSVTFRSYRDVAARNCTVTNKLSVKISGEGGVINYITILCYSVKL